MRFLALGALIVSHSVSFVNNTTKVPLETLWAFRPLQFITIFGILFMFLAAVTFRLGMDQQIRGDRLRDWPKDNMPIYLLGLLIFDALKNYFVYESLNFIFHWDFLKTLFLAYWLIVILARVHILAILLTSVAITAFAQPIKSTLLTFLIAEEQITDQVIGWGLVHTQLLLLAFLAAGLFLRLVWSLSAHRPFKLFLTLMISLLLFRFYQIIEAHQPSAAQYFYFHNWLIYGLTGTTRDGLLYSGTAWLPTVLSSFVICHYCFKLKEFYELNYKWVNFFFFFMALAMLALSFTVEAPYRNIIYIWHLPALVSTSLTFELYKLVSVLNLFFIFTYFNRHFRPTRMEPLVNDFSRASFLIYLVCTSLTPLISNHAAQRYGFWGGSMACIFITFMASCYVALIGRVFMQKRLRLTVMPSTSGSSLI